MVSHDARTACQKIAACHAAPRANHAKYRTPSSTSSVCLISEKLPAPCSVFEADLVFQRLFEELQRRQVARAQPQAFQVQQLNERNDAQQRDRHHAYCRMIAIIMRRPLDQAVRQAQPHAPALLRARHPAAVGFMIHAQQVQHAVQHQDADFLLGRVAELAGLRARTIDGDRDVAQQDAARGPVRQACPENDSTSVA